MCGKGDGLGRFPSDSLETQSYQFDEIAHRTLICRMTVENFVRIVWTVFEKIEKKTKTGRFLVIFGLILLPFLNLSNNFDAIAQTGAPLGVE